MESEDLLILPKDSFREGDAKEFRDFILDKSGASFKWQPANPVNIVKNIWMNIQMKVAMVGQESQDKSRTGKKNIPIRLTDARIGT